MPNMSVPVPGTNHSEVFKDGTHKWGGGIYAVNVFNAKGEPAGRTYLGVVKRFNDHQAEYFGGEDFRYMVNDWTGPEFAMEEGVKVRANNVHHFRTRKQAMAFVNSLA